MRQSIVNVFHSLAAEARKRGHIRPFNVALYNTAMELGIDRNRVLEALCRYYGINNKQRELWLDNDEFLYHYWQESKLSKRDFIKRHKEAINFRIFEVIL